MTLGLIDRMLQNSTCTWWCHERGMGTSSPSIISARKDLLPTKIARAVGSHDRGMGTSSPYVISVSWNLLPNKIAPALNGLGMGMGTSSPPPLVPVGTSSPPK